MLYSLPEAVVGAKLATTLLSRLVVLNPAAQTHLLPHLLVPRTADGPEGLLDVANYRQYILPILARILPVRDAQIRLVLLHYFPHYVGLMDRDHLVDSILPEILLGIKDTDDAVVAATLRSLADLVPMLGGAAVIGGTRLKLFANGAPKTAVASAETSARPTSRKTSAVLRPGPALLPERHEPDGGEDDAGRRTTAAHPLETDDEDRWSDWEEDDDEDEAPVKGADPLTAVVDISRAVPTIIAKGRPAIEDDLSALEIQVKAKEDEIDYFADMAPTISAAKPLAVVVPSAGQLSFNADDKEADADDGWNWDD